HLLGDLLVDVLLDRVHEHLVLRLRAPGAHDRVVDLLDLLSRQRLRVRRQVLQVLVRRLLALTKQPGRHPLAELLGRALVGLHVLTSRTWRDRAVAILDPARLRILPAVPAPRALVRLPPAATARDLTPLTRLL